jgi:hypothetical protein
VPATATNAEVLVVMVTSLVENAVMVTSLVVSAVKVLKAVETVLVVRSSRLHQNCLSVQSQSASSLVV